MPNPPLESFVDDPELGGEECFLLRRVRFDWIDHDQDGTILLADDRNPIVKSTAFQLQRRETARRMGYPDGCISLGLESIVESEENGIERFVIDSTTYGVARISAAEFRKRGFGLQLVPEENQPWHLVAFHSINSSQARLAQTHLAMACQLFQIPTSLQRP